ncbi:hypothetical protein L0337_42120 [candidate division KSB1 bacterium]|nr:hypothetical protein [candidate division KSB1 bacterium]
MRHKISSSLLVAFLLADVLANTGCGEKSNSPNGPNDTPPKPIVLPPGVTKLVLGKAFNNQQDCEITEPFSLPIRFPASTTQVAYQLVIDPEKVQSVQISLKGNGLEGGIRTVYCDKFVIILGSPRQNQYGGTVSRLNGNAFRTGTYAFTFTVDGNSVEVPFDVQ